MNIRSMTGYAQVKQHVSDELTITLSLKSVNHRFLDLHLRMPNELDAVEMKVSAGYSRRACIVDISKLLSALSGRAEQHSRSTANWSADT